MRTHIRKVIPFVTIASLLLTIAAALQTNIGFAQRAEMDFWSGVSMRFGTGKYITFMEMVNHNGILESCDVIALMPPLLFQPYPCSWWELLDPLGNPMGIEFHLDAQYGPNEWHIGTVFPGPFPLPGPGPYRAELKVQKIETCQYYTVHWPAGWYPSFCDWWEILDPETHLPTGYEFHVDWTNESCEFHVDEVTPGPYILQFPWWEIEARRKITKINACEWFTILSPIGYLPQPNTWWEIIYQGQPTGLTFHVDMVDPAGGPLFHVDTSIQSVPPTYPTKARQIIPDHWYIKPPYPDYAPSGMPDFDQKQDMWGPGQGIYTWCGPVSVANSLWWLDSEYESINNPAPVPPPAISDNFPLVSSYNPQVWDDHDQRNVDPLVQNLAFLMDTDGKRTGLAHQGTNYVDMETGISQYLQQQGVNPVGDCDGDGKVEADDINIINLAMGSMPGAPNWDMRADVIISNLIDMADLVVATGNLGSSGQFYEHTEGFADFYWIEEEIERCQDVELFLEFWQWTGTTWIKLYDNPSLESGHFVTCAGVNSTNRELLISDPYWDAFEAGAVQGRSPVAHPYPHSATVHNNTLYVSHDEYVAQLWVLPPPPGYPPGQIWELTGYLQALGYNQNWHAFIRAAVATSPLAVHDVAITDVKTSKDGCIPKATVCQNYTTKVNVTIENQGGFSETFNVTAYASDLLSSYPIGTTTVTLNGGQNTNWAFTWNTNGFAFGAYTVWARADQVAGETETVDNSFTDGTVTVVHVGDVNADNKINILDIVRVAIAFGSRPGDPKWDPNADLNDDGRINILDIVIIAVHFGETYP